MGVDTVLGEAAPSAKGHSPAGSRCSVRSQHSLQRARKNSAVKSHLVLEPGPVCAHCWGHRHQPDQPFRELHVLESELSMGGVVLLRLGNLGCPRELCGYIPILQRGN